MIRFVHKLFLHVCKINSSNNFHATVAKAIGQYLSFLVILINQLKYQHTYLSINHTLAYLGYRRLSAWRQIIKPGEPEVFYL
jgi:hypothetical protein